MPSRASRACAGERHHRADGGDREGAVATAEREDDGAQRPARPGEAAGRDADERERRRDAAADGPDPQRARARPPIPVAGERDADHAEQHAAVLHAGELRRRLAGRDAEDDAGEGLEDQVLRAVGEHRDEDEDREAARLRLAPDLRASAVAERAGLCAAGAGASARVRLDADDGERRVRPARRRTTHAGDRRPGAAARTDRGSARRCRR